MGLTQGQGEEFIFKELQGGFNSGSGVRISL